MNCPSEKAYHADSAEEPTPAGRSAARQAIADLKKLYPESVHQSVYRQLPELMPRFFHFDEYSELMGRTDIGPLLDALRSNSESVLDDSQRTALALLKLGFATDELVNPDYEKRSGEMEAVAADLTRQVRRYWHQNDHLRLKIDIEPTADLRDDGTNVQLLQLRVEDDRHYFTNNLDVRSSGFRWFISFLAAFKEFYSDKSVIVLLDEPALALHARAQRDFLDFIEDTLGDHHQVVYTTHSPVHDRRQSSGTGPDRRGPRDRKKAPRSAPGWCPAIPTRSPPCRGSWVTISPSTSSPARTIW